MFGLRFPMDRPLSAGSCQGLATAYYGTGHGPTAIRKRFSRHDRDGAAGTVASGDVHQSRLASVIEKLRTENGHTKARTPRQGPAGCPLVRWWPSGPPKRDGLPATASRPRPPRGQATNMPPRLEAPSGRIDRRFALSSDLPTAIGHRLRIRDGDCAQSGSFCGTHLIGYCTAVPTKLWDSLVIFCFSGENRHFPQGTDLNAATPLRPLSLHHRRGWPCTQDGSCSLN